ncbi:hypothetical protein ACJJTC_019766 [Scirpophaga incertulas]
MLQSLLQPRENQRPKMIGAMPAVAVRHERRRAEKRGTGRRPSQLPLQMGRMADSDATPSPDQHRLRNELYVCGKVAALHAVVGSLLLGIVVLVVGLVQLSPGAEAAQHRYYLMGAGAALVGSGILGAVLSCYFNPPPAMLTAPLAAKSVNKLNQTTSRHSLHIVASAFKPFGRYF